MKNYDTKRMCFSFSLVVRHRSIDPARIDSALQLKPTRSWRVGDKKRDLDGNIISGIQRESVWIYMEDHFEEVKFFKRISTFFEQADLEKSKEFLCALVDDGARVNIDVRLPGDVNIGDQLSWQTLELMGRLKINLSLEIFPMQGRVI